MTRAARADIYGDAINDELVVKPGKALTSGLLVLDDTVVDGAVHRRGGRGRRRRNAGAARPERVRPLLRPLPAGRRAPRRPRAAGGEPRMNDFPWLTVLWVVPLVGALATAFGPKGALAKQTALVASLVTLVIGIIAATQFDRDGSGFQLTETHTWIEAFGVHYAVGLDGLGLLLVLLTVVLVPIVLLAAWNDSPDDECKPWFAWALALEALSLVVFLATDVFLFYVVFEATLIPAYFLIGGFGREKRSAAALKFLMFQLAGGLVLLGSVIGLYVVSADAGSPSYLYRRPAAARHLHQRGPVALRRLLHRVRRQGTAVPGAHLAGRHHGAGDAADQRAAGLRARQDRHLRHAAVLPRPVPGGLRLGDAAGRGAGADLDRLRRVPGHRPGRRPAADRPDLAEPLRLHHARHLRVHQPGHQRLDPLHGQPRHRDRRAVPDRRLRHQAARHHADQPDGRPREGHAGGGRAVPHRRAWPPPACRG